MPVVVAALYKFTRFADPASLQGPVLEACRKAGVLGTLLLAQEGINGTIAGSRAGIDQVLHYLRSLDGLSELEHKESFAARNPFYRMKVRLKKEIVTMGVPGVDPNELVGDYVEPEDWNELIARDDVLLIDTRNDYEVAIGTFEGAVNPETVTFRDFPKWFREHRAKIGKPKVAMFCTGGIRCEKATAFVKAEGIHEVFHLKGGILKYLETVPEEDSSLARGVLRVSISVFRSSTDWSQALMTCATPAAGRSTMRTRRLTAMCWASVARVAMTPRAQYRKRATRRARSRLSVPRRAASSISEFCRAGVVRKPLCHEPAGPVQLPAVSVCNAGAIGAGLCRCIRACCAKWI